MKVTIVGAFLIIPALLWSQSPQPPPSRKAPSSAQGANSSKQRIQVPKAKVSGFELAPPRAGGTQIGGATRSIGSPTTLLAPRKGKAYGLNPLFQWANSNGKVRGYTFRLLDSSGDEVIFETKVSGTSLKYPDDAPALTPASNYLWTVGPSVGLLVCWVNQRNQRRSSSLAILNARS